MTSDGVPRTWVGWARGAGSRSARVLLSATLFARVLPARAEGPQEEGGADRILAQLAAVEAGPGDVTTLILRRPVLPGETPADSHRAPVDAPPAPPLALTGAQALGPPTWHRSETELWGTVPVWLEGGELTVAWGEDTVTVDQAAPPALAAELPGRVVGSTGGRPVQLAITGPLAQRPQDLRVGFGEGEVLSLQVNDGRILVEWRPGPAPFARSVPVVVTDAAHPARAPALTVVQLRARPSIPVTTRPGVEVTAEVGGRSHGPFVAGEDGIARVVVEVRPGEQIARLSLADAEGGTNRTTVSLAGDGRPGLAATWNGASAEGSLAPAVVVAAVRPDGRPWTGPAPRCVTSFGEELRLAQVGAGRWRGSPGLPPDSGPQVQQIQCDLAMRAQRGVDLPTRAGRTARVRLRINPPELSSAAPRAVVRAWAENGGGERLAPTGLELLADHGALLEPSNEPTQLRMSYDGAHAVAHGADQLRLRLAPEPGTGPVRELSLRCTTTPAGAEVVALARDHRGRPLPGATLSLTTPTGPRSLVADPQGRARATLLGTPSPRWAVVGPPNGAGTRAPCVSAPSAAAPPPELGVLQAALTVPIVAGAVREVFLTTAPQALELDEDAEARITLRLVDGGGGPVRDDTVELRASRGQVGALRQRPDGSYAATYQPDPSTELGRVQITARSPSGRFATTSTELELVPAGTRWWPGVMVGWLGGLNGASSPYVSLAVGRPLQKLDPRLHLRGSLGAYRLRANVPAEGESADVDLQLVAIPIGLGTDLRADRGRFATWTGASVVLAPMRLQVSYGEEDTVSGAQLAPPGAELRIGGALGLRSGELTAELAWLFLASGAVDQGWEGSLGGIVGTLGYRARL